MTEDGDQERYPYKWRGETVTITATEEAMQEIQDVLRKSNKGEDGDSSSTGNAADGTSELESIEPDAWLYSSEIAYSKVRDDRRIAHADLAYVNDSEIKGDVEPLFSRSTITETVQDIVTDFAEDEENIDLAQWQGIKILQQKLEEVFSEQ